MPAEQRDLKVIAEQICSLNWSIRIAAQDELSQIHLSSDWLELLPLIHVKTYSVLSVVAKALVEHLEVCPPHDLQSLLGVALSEKGPFTAHEDLLRFLLEASLVNRRLGVRGKIDLLVTLLELKDPPIPPAALIFIVRALGGIGAKRAITHFDKLLNSPDDKLVFEVIRALKQIQDRKSAIYLEGLFGSEKLPLAAAAVEAYGELGGGGLRALRLYRLYNTRDASVKRSILSALLKFNKKVTLHILIRLFDMETDEGLRFQILKRISQIPSWRSGAFLMHHVAHNASPRIRSGASWALGSLPSVAMVKAIRKGLNSDNPQLRKWAILKAGQLPYPMPEKILRALIANDSDLPELLRQTLVETVMKFPERPWVRGWLLAHLDAGGTVGLTALYGLLLRPHPPLKELLAKVPSLGTQALELTLSLAVDLPFPEHRSLLYDFVNAHASHERYQIRFLVARYLCRQSDESSMRSAWQIALREPPKEFPTFGRLIADAFTQARFSLKWLPVELKPEEHALARVVFAEIRTATWDLAHWSEFIGVIARDDREGPLFTRSLCLEYLGREDRFHAEVLNQLLCLERDPKVMNFLCARALLRPSGVRVATLEVIFRHLVEGEYDDYLAPLNLLSAAASPRLIDPFVDWALKLRNGRLRNEVLKALDSWILRVSAVAPPPLPSHTSTEVVANG